MEFIKIEGTDYPIKEIGFKELIKLEELGMSINDIAKPEEHIFTIIGALVSLTTGKNFDEACQIVQKHIVSDNGDVKDYAPLLNNLTNSSFIKALIAKSEKTETETK